jgi:CPA1 family monovalent cation:H+ antiporter
MQPAIAIMATSLFLSMVLLIADRLGFHVIHHDVTAFVNKLHFHDVLMNCMLGLLLFASSLTVDISLLKKQRWEIAILSTIGVIVSTFLVGFIIYIVLQALYFKISLVYCLLFGALISPTDPIAVIATLRQANAPKKIGILLTGESLFNDGIAVVLFVTLYHLTFTSEAITITHITLLFLQRSLGGIAFGLILGMLTYWLMRPVDDHKIAILFTIALVTGGYTLAQALDISGPLAMVTTGIFIASNKNKIFRSKINQEHLESFWELIDELLNAILFGFEILLVRFSLWLIIAAFCAVIVVLLVRLITIAIPMRFAKYWREYPPNTVRILTWGGLRGGLAVALALSIPAGSVSNILLPMTYVVVLFSILIQGSTIKWLVKKSKFAVLDNIIGTK